MTESEIIKHGLKMGYSGKITPYIKGRILADMKNRGETKEMFDEIKTDPIKKSPKQQTVGSKIKRGIKRTSAYLSYCGGRYREYQEPESDTPIKTKTPKKARKNPVKKTVKKPVKKSASGVTKKSGKIKKRTAAGARKTQANIEKEIMAWV